MMEMAIKATKAELDDAGLSVKDLDGFSLYPQLPSTPERWRKRWAEMGVGEVGSRPR